MHAFIAGFGLSLSLILAIGAQNAFVLRQGLIGRHVFVVCAICALSDALLILVGVFAMASLEKVLPNIANIMRYGGVLFLLFYGLSRFHNAYKAYRHHKNESLTLTDSNTGVSYKRTVLTILALTFLNPHVYIDTVLLLGTVANRYQPQHGKFAIGAVLASFIFFFSLGYGAYYLRAIFAKPMNWVWLDLAIGVFMLYLAVQLFLYQI